MITKSQNELLLHKLMIFYNNSDHLTKMLTIINGESKISLRIVDWFSTNYAKKYFTFYENNEQARSPHTHSTSNEHR
jgi:hypothetical protein